MASPEKTRLRWVDHLRTFVILLVVNMHACVTYGHVGDWYYLAEHEPSQGEKLLFLFWQAHLQSFFMGVLFFVAGYFAFGSLARRRPGGFMRERLWRLGVPTLIYMLVIHPFILFGIDPWRHDFGPFRPFYRRYLTSGGFLGGSGPMWFAFALLIFSALLALAGASSPHAQAAPATDERPPPSGLKLLVFGVGLGLLTFFVRLYQPLGTSIMNFQLGYFAQYVAAFIAGLAAARQGWLISLAGSKAARKAGWLGMIAGPVVFFTLLYALQRHGGRQEDYLGGWNLPALGLAMWEQLTGVGLALGAMALCFRFFSGESAALRWMSDRSFGVYLLHPPILIALTLAFRGMPPHPIFQAMLLTVVALAASFLAVELLRRFPGVKYVI